MGASLSGADRLISTRGYQTPRPDRSRIASGSKQSEALAAYDKTVALYMTGQFDKLPEHLRVTGKYRPTLKGRERLEVEHIRRTFTEHRPSWWSGTKSKKNTTFRADIWKRKVTANYIPSEFLGAQAPLGVTRDGKMVVVVTWRPKLIDNPTPATGQLALRHGIRLGDIGELIVWHELGHNYITVFMSVRDVAEAYTNHRALFGHLQEFFADSTAIYHGSPGARRATLMMRLDELSNYDENEVHTRAAHSINSIILADVLTKPDKWPSFHLPGKLPTKQVELNTIIYMLEHWDPYWTVTEDKNLRDLIQRTVHKQGERVFRRRGVLALPNFKNFSLLVAKDKKYQDQRDQWVAQQLKKHIAAGRGDDPALYSEVYKPGRQTLTLPNGKQVYLMKKRSGPRIDIPY